MFYREAMQIAEMHHLRRQLNLLPVDVKDDARINYTLTQMNIQRSLQDFQCRILIKVEEILKKEMTKKGDDHRKYRMGGQEDDTYERFFRIEPSRFMSKPQFTTALRLVFGENMIKSSSMINKLYDSFDLRRVNEMDWRSMLFMLHTLMQPTLPSIEQVKLGYALYSSVGCLDTACVEKLPLGVLKDLIVTPVQLSMRPTLMANMDQAWQHLMQHDQQVILYSAKAAEKFQKHDLTGKGLDPNAMKIPFKFFMKLLTETSMAQYFEVAKPFGKRDPRPWSYHLEETFYHPFLLQRIKALRREYRNEDMADCFLTQQNYRKKRFMYTTWVEFVRRRIKLRVVLIAAEIRATIANYHVYITHMRKVCMEYRAAVQCQRVIRGFLSRMRRQFIKRLQRKVTKMQSSTRQYLQRLSYSRQKMRVYWAAVTIQRVIRGRIARIRVSTMVQALFDARIRQLAKDRADWMFHRMTRAMMCIRRYWHRYCRRKKKMEEMRLRDLEDEVWEEMQRVQEEARISWELYKQALSRWYEERKIQYDEEVLSEQHTKEQKKLLIERRAKVANEIKLRRKKEQEIKLAKLEEEQIEFWLKNWEEIIIKRGEQRRQMCKNALRLPETPEEILLKKDIAVRTKANIKNVLRRADMQKIPMEIPEAFTISEQEIIEEEVQSAMAQARQEMKEEGLRLEEEKRRKAEQQRLDEIAEKQRKAKWAVVTIQIYARMYLARRTVRQKAYSRYTKFFDREYHEYYYQDNVTKQCSWQKPKCLGSYDITMEDYWMVLPVRRAKPLQPTSLLASLMPQAPQLSSETPVGIEATFETFYYYQPSSWKQTWIQPEYTVLCNLCQAEFAQHYVHLDYQCYCSGCLHKQVYEVWTVPSDLYPTPYHLRDIVFQNFNGGRIDASYMDMSNIPVQDFYTFIMKLDPSLQMSFEEEEEENHRFQVQRRRKRMSQELHHCLQCQTQIATMFCADCPKNHCIYCGSCDIHVHRKGKRKYHKRQRLLLDQARSAAKAAAEKRAQQEEDTRQRSAQRLPRIDQLGKSVMHSFFGQKALGEEDDENNFEDMDNDEDNSSAASSKRDALSRQGSMRLPPILPSHASLKEGPQRQHSQRIDGQESSSASSDSEATKHRKAKEKQALERKEQKKSSKEVNKKNDDDGGSSSPEKKKIKKKTKKMSKKKPMDNVDSDIQTDIDGHTEVTDTAHTTANGEKKEKKKKKQKDEIKEKKKSHSSPSKDTSSSRIEEILGEVGDKQVSNKRPFSSPDGQKHSVSNDRQLETKKKSKMKKKNTSSPTREKTTDSTGVKLPPIANAVRSNSAPSTSHLSNNHEVVFPPSEAEKDDNLSKASSAKSKNTKKKKQKASTQVKTEDEDNSDIYDAGDESSVFTKDTYIKDKNSNEERSAVPKSTQRKKTKKMKQEAEEKDTPTVQEEDGKEEKIAKAKKVKRKKSKLKPSSETIEDIDKSSSAWETDMSQLTDDYESNVEDNDGKDNANMSVDKKRSMEPPNNSNNNNNNNNSNDDAINNNYDYENIDNDIISKSSANEKVEKKKKKKKKKPAKDASSDVEKEESGYSSPDQQKEKRKKKKKKLISGVLAGLEGNDKDHAFDSDAANSSPDKKKKKPKKTKKSTDPNEVDYGYSTATEETTASTMKKKKRHVNDSVEDGINTSIVSDSEVSGSGFSTNAPTKQKKKKKTKKPSLEEDDKSQYSSSQYTADTGTNKKRRKKKAKHKSDEDESTIFSSDSPMKKKKKKKTSKKSNNNNETTASTLIAALDNMGI